MASVKIHSPGRPKGLTRQATEQRHHQWYRLFLQGLSETQIAESFNVSQSSVSTAINRVRREGSWGDMTARQRFEGLLQETYDSIRLSMAEAWRMFHDPGNRDKPALRTLALGRAQASIALLTRLMPDLESLSLQERIAEVAAEQRKVQQMILEEKMRSRILPVQTGS